MNKPLLIMSAPVATRSGYGDHSRDLLRSLIAMDKYDIKVMSQRWGDCPLNALNDKEDQDIISRLWFGNQLPKQPDIWIQVTVPNEFQPVGKYNIGVTAGIETTHISHQWIEGLNRMDLNIVPSVHSRNSILNSVYDKMDEKTKQKVGELKCEKPIEVLFEGLDTNVFKKVSDAPLSFVNEMKNIKEEFCFLFVGHWLKGDYGHDRKDVAGMIKTFCETFKGHKTPKPALILKSSHATFSVIDREQTINKINEIKQMVGGSLPSIYVLHGDMTQEEMNALYNHPKVKAHISFTHGEGFGRPLLEASSTQKPVIASNWSGHIDFLKHSVLLPGQLNNVHKSAAWKDVILKESKWYYVDHAYAKKVLKAVYKKYKKFLPAARIQAKYTRDNFSLDKMTKDFQSILESSVPAVPEQVKLTLPKLKKVGV
tara:strand:- start:11502 stop:12779 length:1278 start_codon:yes stop_codon:yes gene_type:complete